MLLQYQYREVSLRIFLYLLTALWAAGQGIGADLAVPAGGNFQLALDAAQPGDTITLQAGATYQGAYSLPFKPGANWITIRSSAEALLPRDGVRVAPADAVNMPKLMASTSNPIITATGGAHHFRFVGIEFVPQPGVYNYNLLTLGIGNETSLTDLPQYLELDRVYIHGDLDVGTKRAITLNAKDTVIKNSWISDIASTYQETQAIQGWNGPGPYRIENNRLESAAIGILFGGATPTINGAIPSGIQVLRNYFFKPLSWKKNSPSYAGKPWWIKNHFEIKNAQRVTLDGNIFENVWEDQQSGFAILLALMTESGAVPWTVDQDITITNNIVRHASSGINISGCDSNGICGGRRITIRNNLFEDINSVAWGGYGRLFQVLNKAESVSITHNTGFQSSSVVFSDGLVPNTGFVFENNLAPENGYGIVGSGMGIGNTALAYYFPGSLVTGNLLSTGNASVYPAGNFFPPSIRDAGFVNMGSGDYRIAATSPYRNAATDGKAVGVDMDALEAATASTISGNPFAAAVPQVFGLAGTASFVKTDMVTQGNWSGVYGAGGYSIATLNSTIPAGAGLTFRQSATLVWNGSAPEVQALLNPATGSRIAAAYTGPSWFSFELNLDTPRQVAIYNLDYDNRGRVQVIDILDRRTGALLDSRTVDNFQAGKYLVWNLSGHVVVQVSTSQPLAAPAISGIFLGEASTPPPPAGASAVFVSVDNATQGSWRGVYGAEGYQIAMDGISQPAYAQTSLQANSLWQYARTTSDVRALQKAAKPNQRVAAAWNSASSFTLNLTFTGSQTHDVAFYIADYNNQGRVQTIEIFDAVTGSLLSTRTEAAFGNGRYLKWKLGGNVRVRFTRSAGSSAVLSGIFFR